jgi:peroxiredoxin
VLKAGNTAPSFVLNDPDSRPVSSAGLLAQGPLVISFYRGIWCPYCNMELQALHEAWPAFGELGANLVAISPQSTINSHKSRRTNGLDFTILPDPANETAAAFGLSFASPDYLIKLCRSPKNDLPAFNRHSTAPRAGRCRCRGRFVISRDRVIRYAEVNPDYTHPTTTPLLDCYF